MALNTINQTKQNLVCHNIIDITNIRQLYYYLADLSQALEFRTPLFPHLVPPTIMVWIFVWKYIFEPFIHILQHFVLQLSRSTNFCYANEQSTHHFWLCTGTRNLDPLFPHLVPHTIMVWIFVWKYFFEPFIHILQSACA
jgi:hypothetical protein